MIEALELLGRLALGLATLLGLGYVLAASLVPGLTRLERAAAGFGLGALVVTLWMLALSSLGLHFSLPLVLLPLLVLAAGLQFFNTVREQRHPGADLPPPAPPVPPAPYGVWDWVFIGLLIALFLLVIPRAVMYPIWAWDAISTWGFKAKVFYQRGIVDLGGFQAHNYYPDLVPLLCTYLYLWLGQVNDHLVKLVFPLWGGAFLALLFGMLRRLGLGRTLALGLTAFFALNGITFITHMHIVYADLSLTYFTLGAVGFLYLWLTGAAPPGTLPLAALFFAGLPWSKFEGPPLAGTILLAAALTLLWLRPPRLTRRLASLGLAPGRTSPGIPPLAALCQVPRHRNRLGPHPGVLRLTIVQGRPGHVHRPGEPHSLRHPVARHRGCPGLLREKDLHHPPVVSGPVPGRQFPGHPAGLRRGPHLRRRIPPLPPGHPRPLDPAPDPGRGPAPGGRAQGADVAGTHASPPNSPLPSEGEFESL